MKITIESTVWEIPHKIVVETGDDDVDAEEALRHVKLALVAWGYHWDQMELDNK